MAATGVSTFTLGCATIGSLYPDLTGSIPSPELPDISFRIYSSGATPPAFTIAVLGAVESLLSAVVARYDDSKKAQFRYGANPLRERGIW